MFENNTSHTLPTTLDNGFHALSSKNSKWQKKQTKHNTKNKQTSRISEMLFFLLGVVRIDGWALCQFSNLERHVDVVYETWEFPLSTYDFFLLLYHSKHEWNDQKLEKNLHFSIAQLADIKRDVLGWKWNIAKNLDRFSYFEKVM